MKALYCLLFNEYFTKIFVFVFQPVFNATLKKKITRVELGGPVGGTRERIFAASGSEIKGFTKKGKNFLTFDTSLAEPIQTM